MAKTQHMQQKNPKTEFTHYLDKEFLEMPKESIINGFQATCIYNLDTYKPDRTKLPKTIFSQDLVKYNN